MLPCRMMAVMRKTPTIRRVTISLRTEHRTGPSKSGSQELGSHVQNGELVVPPGNFFAMGDNREHSADSRFWGFVPRENILGRPLFNYWSLETAASQTDAQQPSLVRRISSFFTTALHLVDKTRWSRTGHLIR